MPMYSFYCLRCDADSSKICKIDERDSQNCVTCGMPLQRKIDRPGWVWRPSSMKA